VQFREGIGREQARNTGIGRELPEERVSAEYLQVVEPIPVREEECGERTRWRRRRGRVCVRVGRRRVRAPGRVGAWTRRGGGLLPRSACDAG
jgi:hypothetical protein